MIGYVSKSSMIQRIKRASSILEPFTTNFKSANIPVHKAINNAFNVLLNGETIEEENLGVRITHGLVED